MNTVTDGIARGVAIGTASGVERALAPLVKEFRRIRDENAMLRRALRDARARLRGAGMLGGDDDPVNAAIAKADGRP